MKILGIPSGILLEVSKTVKSKYIKFCTKFAYMFSSSPTSKVKHFAFLENVAWLRNFGWLYIVIKNPVVFTIGIVALGLCKNIDTLARFQILILTFIRQMSFI